MRLSDKEITIIQNTLYTYFGKNIKIYLFGSRIDDNKTGGDIDLYIQTQHSDNFTYQRLLSKAKLKERLYKPIDLIVSNSGDSSIAKEAFKGVQIG
jgi:predicted nucleotidyltransferase